MRNNFILICSDEIEGTTDEVCKWLNYLNKKFIRVSKNDIIDIISIEISNKHEEIFFKINDDKYKLSDISSYWYRRSYLNFKKNNSVEFNFKNSDIEKNIIHFLKDEENKIFNYFENKLNEKSKINKFGDIFINKLKVLIEAKKLKINIPKTLVIKDLKKLKNCKSRIITKAISDFVIETETENFYNYTEEVNVKSIDFNEKISFSLFQDLVEKDFEVRSFYFNKKFYSSAIFSQSNEKTKLDFRHYDNKNPNRVVPYKLPKVLEKKLQKLLDSLSLNSGSFDFAVDKNGNHILFEINPVGQFEQVFLPCNYRLIEDIAKFL